MERLDEGATHGVDADPQDLSQDGDLGPSCQEKEEFDVPCTTRGCLGLCSALGRQSRTSLRWRDSCC